MCLYIDRYLFMAALGLAVSSCSEQGLLSSCGARTSHRRGFSGCRAWALGAWVSVGAVHGL